MQISTHSTIENIIFIVVKHSHVFVNLCFYATHRHKPPLGFLSVESVAAAVVQAGDSGNERVDGSLAAALLVPAHFNAAVAVVHPSVSPLRQRI